MRRLLFGFDNDIFDNGVPVLIIFDSLLAVRHDLARCGMRSDLDTHVAEMFISASLRSVARWEMLMYRTKLQMVVFREIFVQDQNE